MLLFVAIFKGQGVEFENLDLSGRLEVNNGSYDNIPVEKLECHLFIKKKDLLQIDAFNG